MLAYVFWHWPLATISEHNYREHLIEFHRSLRNHPFAGFHFSHVFQLEDVPWGLPGASLYEDWYVIENFATLDTLNRNAVTAANKAPHDRAAQAAADGKAGLYQLCAGEATPDQANIACWFSKPTGMSYDAFRTLIYPFVEQHGGALWQRQMTLGPTPEFCYWTATNPILPDTIMGITRFLTPIWSGKEL